MIRHIDQASEVDYTTGVEACKNLVLPFPYLAFLFMIYLTHYSFINMDALLEVIHTFHLIHKEAFILLNSMVHPFLDCFLAILHKNLVVHPLVHRILLEHHS